MADNIDSKILGAYIDGIVDGREMRRQEWLEWLEKIRDMNYSSVIKDYNEKIKAIETKIQQLKKERT